MKIFFSFLLVMLTTASFAQVDTLLPPYQRYPAIPFLQLLLTDSTTKYTKADLPKKKPVLIMLFSPDCEHCQHEAEEFVTRNEDLKKIHIIMVTNYPIYRMKEFAAKYGLEDLKNVVVARDASYLLPTFYAIKSLPYFALYDKKGNLLKTHEGSLSIDTLIDIFNINK